MFIINSYVFSFSEKTYICFVKTKCYFILLVVIGLFFAVNQQSVVVPNQEIKLQFSEITSKQVVGETLKSVKEQLQALGALKITIIKNEDNSLKVSYFSKETVFKIQELLSDVAASKTSITSVITLDVYEIKKASTPSSGFEKNSFIEHNKEFDRFVSSNVFMALQLIKYKGLAVSIQDKTALKQNIVLCLSNTLHNIPEVRAGPKV